MGTSAPTRSPSTVPRAASATAAPGFAQAKILETMEH